MKEDRYRERQAAVPGIFAPHCRWTNRKADDIIVEDAKERKKEKMRRKDREVSEISEILKVIDECKICRVGFWDSENVYMVPMNFGYEYEEEYLVFYFHGAKSGRKYDIIADNPNVGFEMDCGHDLIVGDSACEYSYRFASVIGNGSAEVVSDIGEKKKALALIMKQQTGGTFTFDDKQAAAVNVWKVTTREFTCKKY